MNQARLEYSKVDGSYNLVMQMYPNNPSSTSMPLNMGLFKDLIKLFNNTGKIEKALRSMERNES